MLVDSTIVRVHQHAAGARRKKKVGAERSAESQTLGRSRVGLSTKVVVMAVDDDTSQADNAGLRVPMVDPALGQVLVIDELIGDRNCRAGALFHILPVIFTSR
jgi:hypothetical protein